VLEHGLSLGLSEQWSVCNKRTNNIGVDVRSGSSILDVSSAYVFPCLSWDSERGSAVSNTVGESGTGRGLVVTSESLLIVFTVDRDVKGVFGTESGHHILNVLHALNTWSHGFGWVVGVASRSIPVGEELRGVWDVHIIIFSNTAEEVSRNVELITDGNTFNWADLVFPLSRHDLGIGAWNLDTSIQASLVMSFSNSASEGNVGASRAVVGTLGTGVTTLRPAEGLLGELGV
jgi:hypothetical protein